MWFSSPQILAIAGLSGSTVAVSVELQAAAAKVGIKPRPSSPDPQSIKKPQASRCSRESQCFSTLRDSVQSVALGQKGGFGAASRIVWHLTPSQPPTILIRMYICVQMYTHRYVYITYLHTILIYYLYFYIYLYTYINIYILRVKPELVLFVWDLRCTSNPPRSRWLA